MPPRSTDRLLHSLAWCLRAKSSGPGDMLLARAQGVAPDSARARQRLWLLLRLGCWLQSSQSRLALRPFLCYRLLFRLFFGPLRMHPLLLSRCLTSVALHGISITEFKMMKPSGVFPPPPPTPLRPSRLTRKPLLLLALWPEKRLHEPGLGL